MLYRRFGYVHSRLLLYRQDELRELEESLYEMDKHDENSEDGRLCLASREIDNDREDLGERESRSSLIDRMEKKAFQYGISGVYLTNRSTPVDVDARSTAATSTATRIHEPASRA